MASLSASSLQIRQILLCSVAVGSACALDVGRVAHIFHHDSLRAQRTLLPAASCLPSDSINVLVPSEYKRCFGLGQRLLERRKVLKMSRGGATTDGDESTSSQETPLPGPANVLSYYLLWSPGIFKKTVYTFIALWMLKLASVAPSPFLLQEPIVLPLLSSACCGIQLFINAVVGAGGCAGFNKYLGPLRPYFLGILLYATTMSFSGSFKWARYTLLRWSVALMPEMVHLWNVEVAEKLLKTGQNGEMHTTIEISIPTMGCVACINKIDSSIRQCAPEQIEQAKSWLDPGGKGGRAYVKAVASSPESAEKLAETVVQAIRNAGFESPSLESVETTTKE